MFSFQLLSLKLYFEHGKSKDVLSFRFLKSFFIHHFLCFMSLCSCLCFLCLQLMMSKPKQVYKVLHPSYAVYIGIFLSPYESAWACPSEAFNIWLVRGYADFYSLFLSFYGVLYFSCTYTNTNIRGFAR